MEVRSELSNQSTEIENKTEQLSVSPIKDLSEYSDPETNGETETKPC